MSSTLIIIALLKSSTDTSLAIQFRLGMVAAVKTYSKRLKQEVGLNAETCKATIAVFFTCLHTFNPTLQNQLAKTDEMTLFDTYFETCAHYIVSLNENLTKAVCNNILEEFVLNQDMKLVCKHNYMMILVGALLVVKSVSFDVFNLLKKLKDYLLNFQIYISEYDALFSNQGNINTNDRNNLQFTVNNNQVYVSDLDRN